MLRRVYILVFYTLMICYSMCCAVSHSEAFQSAYRTHEESIFKAIWQSEPGTFCYQHPHTNNPTFALKVLPSQPFSSKGNIARLGCNCLQQTV